MQGYDFIAKHRQLMKRGGVAMYRQNDIIYIRREDLEINMEGENESIFIETQHNKKNIVVGEIYTDRIPDTNLRTSINRYYVIISKLTDTHKDIIIATDQNCNYLKFDQHNNTEDLLNIFLNNGIIPTNY